MTTKCGNAYYVNCLKQFRYLAKECPWPNAFCTSFIRCFTRNLLSLESLLCLEIQGENKIKENGYHTRKGKIWSYFMVQKHINFGKLHYNRCSMAHATLIAIINISVVYVLVVQLISPFKVFLYFN